MKMTKVFIDGRSGTTGLRIYERLGERDDVELITLSEEDRKSPKMRAEALNSCDVAVLCLPDAASREAIAMIENPKVKVLDTSTAHRTLDGWSYGFPELSTKHREGVKNGTRIAVPGCHASGFVALVHPLIKAGILSVNSHLTCHSITGYSGGGKSMIAEYGDKDRSVLLDSPRQYGVTQNHKHLPEMTAITGLKNEPVFCPIVSDYYSGMLVTVPIHKAHLVAGAIFDDIRAAYETKYDGPIVSYKEQISENGFIASNGLSGLDTMEVTVEGNGERGLLIARFDNLGKGASGAAIQCFNILTGAEETKGLKLC